MTTPGGTNTGSETLEKRIAELRRAGEYEQALGAARELLAARCGEVEAKAWEIEDVRRLVETLEHVADLPPQAQASLAGADRLRLEFHEQLVRAEYDRAVEAGAKDLNLRRQLFGDEHPEVATSLHNLATGLRAKGDYAGAESLQREALAMRRKLLGAEHPEVAASLHDLGECLRAKGEYAVAESLLREALAMRRKFLGAEHLDVALSLSSIAGVIWIRGDYPGAESLYREALAMRRKILGDENRTVAANLSNLGGVIANGGEYERAEPFQREALAMQRKLLGTEHPDVAMTLNNLAALLWARGDYAGAEPLHREALAIRRKVLGAGHPYVAQSLHNLAALIGERGDAGRAEALVREALAMWRENLGAEHPYVANCLNNLGEFLLARDDYAGAEPHYRAALAMYQKCLGSEHPEVANSLNNLARFLCSRGDYEGAESLMRQALAMWQKLQGAEHEEVAASLSNLAELFGAKGDYADAELLEREALAMRRRFLGDAHPYVLRSMRNLARVLRDRGALEEAERVFAEAAEVYEVARLRAGWGLARVTFEASPNPELAALRLRLGREEEAWPAVERSLGRVLAELLAAAKHHGFSAAESGRLDELAKSLSKLERQVATLAERGEAEALAEARTKLLIVEAEWSALAHAIAERHPVTEGQGYPLERVQWELGVRSALVGWLDVEERRGEWRVWAYAVRPGEPVVWVDLSAEGPGGARQEEVRRFRELVSAPAGHVRKADELGRAVWEARLAPLAAALSEVEDLVVMPSGAMLGVPVEALVTADGTYVGERYRVSYTPSATVHAWLKEERRRHQGERRQRPERALLIGDPPFSAWQAEVMEREMLKGAWEASDEEAPADGELLVSAVRGNQAAIGRLTRLAGSRREVALTAELFRSARVLLGREATEEALAGMAVRGELGRMEVIHLATHALVDEEQPEQSALVLSQVDLPDALEAAIAGTRIYDGLVRAGEVVREWKLEAELVVLSACETGLGKKMVGEGYVGLAHAFLQAGARSVLVSLWQVDDEATVLLMRRFYEGWLEAGLGKAEALQEAKRWLREREDAGGRRRFAHPYYWSAFVLIGAED